MFPFFLLIVVGGIIDFGFTFYNMIALQQLSDDVALYAAEGKGSSLGLPSIGDITTYVTNKKPTWWAGEITTTVLPDGVVSDGSANKVKKIKLSYESPLYTPFWQTATQVVGGNKSITLSVMSAYQVPAVVITR